MYSRPAGTSSGEKVFFPITALKCVRNPSCNFSVKSSTSASSDPVSIALSAAGIAGPRSRPGLKTCIGRALASSVDAHQRLEKVSIGKRLRFRTELAYSHCFVEGGSDFDLIFCTNPDQHPIYVVTFQGVSGRCNHRSVKPVTMRPNAGST